MDDPQNRDEDDVLDATPNRADLLAQPGGATGSDTRLHASEPAIVEPARVAALVEAACHMIEPECGDGYAYLQPQLEAIASRYLSDKAACLPALPPKLVRETLRHIGSLTTDLMDQLAALPNDVATALGSLVPPLEENAVPDLTLCDQGVEALALLRQATDSFDQAYGPPTGRGVNVALQSALLAAMTVIKTATGEVLRARIDKPAGTPPEFVTPAARAIRDLLVGIDPRLNDAAIFHMLEKLRTRGPSVSYADTLEAPGLAVELDLCLHSNRKPE